MAGKLIAYLLALIGACILGLMKYDFVAIGDITTDAFIKLKDFDEIVNHGKHEVCISFGDKVAYEEVIEIRAVGNSANAAVSAKRLGLSSALITMIGDDDNGAKCLETLKGFGVSDEFVGVEKGKPTNYHYVLMYGPERTILVKHYERDYKLPAFTDKPTYLYFSSIAENTLAFHHEVAAYVAANPEVKLVFQPGTFQMKIGTTELADIYKNTEIFFCNREEAARILGTEERDVRKLSEGLAVLGPKIVSVTDGPDGAYVFTDNTLWYVPEYPDPAPPISRTGAGDAFASTLTSYLAKGMSIQDALLRAPINSMNVVQHVGAQTGLLTHDEIEAWLAKAPADYKVSQM
jgi:ribokinase